MHKYLPRSTAEYPTLSTVQIMSLTRSGSTFIMNVLIDITSKVADGRKAY